MSLNLTHLFTSWGRAGRNAYLINGTQALQATPFNELVAESWVNPAWISNLAQSYDVDIRNETQGMSDWTAAATNILLGLVSADSPEYGQDISSALTYVYNQMVAQAYYVQSCTITQTVTAFSTNIGNGSVYVGLIRGDGIAFQNVIAENATLLITADSYTGGATLGQEPWQYNGAPNVSSLATGVSVGNWDWDFPQGSGVAVTGNCIAANAYAQSNGNLLTNGDFATWTVALSGPSNWNLVTGAWGTDAQRSSTVLSGTYSLEFLPTSTLTAVTQQFGSSSTTTGATAGTTASVSAYNGYVVNFYLKAAGVISGGILSISLVDGSGTVINDQQGTPNTTTVSLSALSTNWVAHTTAFRLPVVTPTTVRLRFKITTALAGAGLYLDWVSMTAVQANTGTGTGSGGAIPLYEGGPSLAVFSNPAAPFQAVPNQDGWTVALTNNLGSATYWNANWQQLVNTLFQTPALILPTSGSTLLNNTLITGA